MKLAGVTRLDRNVRRAGDIIGALIKYRLADWVKDLASTCVRRLGTARGVLAARAE
jgi:hypothetical protein